MDPAKMMPKQNLIGATHQDMMWHTGAANVPQTHGAVSVVTTVYSNVPRYSGSAQTFNGTAMHSNSAPNVYGVGGGPAVTASYGSGPKTAVYCGDAAYPPYDHQTYQPSVPPEYSSGAPQQAALNAAQVAAAAVATATATAVAIDQSQFQPYHPNSQPGPYANASYPHVGMAPQNPYGPDPRLSQQRPAMPPQYVSAVRNTRQPLPGNRYPSVGAKGAPRAVPAFPNGHLQQPGSYAGPVPGTQGMMPSGGNRPLGPGPGTMYPANSYNARLQSPNMRSPQYPMQPTADGCYTPQLSNYGIQGMQQVQPYQQNIRPNVSFANVPGLPNNPTPPLMPSSSSVMVHPPGYTPGSSVLPGAPSTMPDVKPSMNAQAEDAEPRITFPVRDGILLQPFRLEHNAPVSQHVFILDDRTYHQLCTNPNLDLQLKCFHAEDKTMSNNWPHNASIQMCVNGTPVAVRLVERPLYIKSLCQKQKNTLQIAVQQCCCSHLFLLTLVNRPTIETVVRQLVRQRLLSPDHCIEKIRSFFQSGEAAQMRNAEGCVGNPEIVQMSINMSLKCPITMKRIELPARGQECRHPQCFDLRSYLAINKERSTWLCPICKRLAMLDSLQIDQYVWGILTNLNNCDVDEVTIDGAAAWKPIVRQSATGAAVKTENEVPCNNGKRFKADPGSDGGNICTWGQQAGPSPAAPLLGQQFQMTSSNGQGPVCGLSAAVRSPYYANSSPGGLAQFVNANPSTPAACHPQAAPAPSANGVSVSTASTSGPNTPRQSMGPLTPHNTRCGPLTPVTPQHANPPSVGPPPRSVGNPPSVDNPNKGLPSGVYNSQRSQQLQHQSSVDASFPGSAPYTPVSVSSAGTSTNNVPNTLTATETGNDFPDFTFDASDLLGSGDVAQQGQSLFNDPEELMKYLADDGDFSAFNASSHAGGSNGSYPVADGKQRSSHSTSMASDPEAKSSSSASTGGKHGGNYATQEPPTHLTTMEDILSFLDK